MKWIFILLALMPSFSYAQASMQLKEITGQLSKIKGQYVLYECINGAQSKYPQFLDFEYKEWKGPELPAVLTIKGQKLNKAKRDEIYVNEITKTYTNSTCDNFFDISEYSLDLFTGSIEMKDGVLIMRRCDIGDTEYILRPSPKAKTNFVKTLQEKKLDPNNTTTLIAHYIEIGDKHGLEIFEIAEIKQNQNCHLMDLF